MAGTGSEHPQETSGNTKVAPQGAAKCAAVDAQSAPVDARLAEVIDAWPALPEEIKAGILAMVKAAR